MKTILVVDDNVNILTSVKLLMKSKVDNVLTTPLPEEIPDMLRRHQPQVVLLDMNFNSTVNTGNEGLFWLKEIRRLSPSTAVILFTAYADVRLAVEGMKLGAADFVVKPYDPPTLVATISNAFISSPNKKKKSGGMAWGESEKIREIRHIVERVAPTDANILIVGENGTGKDLLAREIHRLSNRCSGPMEVVDMGAIIETLFESELYGHVKGAFTDAKSDRVGKFETAHSGTLFLDEIGNLPLHLQAKLLTSIQQRQIVRVGSNAPRDIDIRLICATNRDIPSMVDEGKFRQDLFYRINTVTLRLPSLRERIDDVPMFANIFAEKYAKVYGKPTPAFSADAISALKSYSWPGNIRQLEHTIERAMIMSDAPVLQACDFDLPQALPENNINQGGTLDDIERAAIAAAIKAYGSNLAEVARQLGITRQTLYNKIKKYGL